ncbi:MAG: hypothetical protein ACJAR3_002218 [Roseivirga sp.]|jgi:hypothetical protein
MIWLFLSPLIIGFLVAIIFPNIMNLSKIDSCLDLGGSFDYESCSSAVIDCENLKGFTSKEIDIKLSSMDKTSLSHEIYTLGECKNQAAIPVLKKYINDERMTHHMLHKGMSIGYLAQGSIERINGK